MSTRELSLSEAFTRLIRVAVPVTGHEQIDTRAADRRVLATDLRATIDLPPFDNAAMDGYALHAADLTAEAGPLPVIDRAYAGHASMAAVEPGTCVRITTGAPLPAGTAAVVIQEDTEVDLDRVRVLRLPPNGANIRRCGEHVKRGDCVLRGGRRLRPTDLGLACAVGADRIEVVRRLRVGCLSTGDELTDPPAPLAAGASYDANRPFLLATLIRLGFEAVDLGICADRADAFESKLAGALDARLDALVVSGGAAQGDADIVRRAGGIEFLPVDFRPGRGVAWTRLDASAERSTPLLLLGLPGNAVACYTMFHLLAVPVLLHLAGAMVQVPVHVDVPLAAAAQVRGGHVDYRRARWVRTGAGTWAAGLLKDQGSAMLRTVCEADMLIALGPAPEAAAGTHAPAVLLDTLE